MFFEEKLIFIICFITLGLFALYLFLDNMRLMFKNAYLRKENKELKKFFSKAEKIYFAIEDTLRPYFDDEKGRTVDPKKKNKMNIKK